mgnify:CR=1 FL=1
MIVAIVVPEIPRVVGLVRAIVVSVREEPYIEAAIMAGTPVPPLLVLPNTAPCKVNGWHQASIGRHFQKTHGATRAGGVP